MLDPSLRSGLQAIEHAFGSDWLTHRGSHRGTDHDVRNAWRRATAWLSAAEAGSPPIFRSDKDEAMWELLDMGRALEGTQHLEGYGQAITTALLRQSDWRNHIYVAQVAHWAMAAGYDVAFLRRRKGRRTADLELRRENKVFHLECKHKAPYMRKAPSAGAWDALSDGLIEGASSHAADIDLGVACVGKLDYASVPDFIKAAQTAIQSIGIPVPAGYCGAVIARPPLPNPPLTDGGFGIWLPSISSHATASGRISVSNGAIASVGPVHRVFLFQVDGHDATQLRDSIASARGQPDSVPGIIYIRIDDTFLPNAERDIYFKAIENFLLNEISQPENSNVAAITLTGAASRILNKPDKSHYLVERPALGVMKHDVVPRSWGLPLPPTTASVSPGGFKRDVQHQGST